MQYICFCLPACSVRIGITRYIMHSSHSLIRYTISSRIIKYSELFQRMTKQMTKCTQINENKMNLVWWHVFVYCINTNIWIYGRFSRFFPRMRRISDVMWHHILLLMSYVYTSTFFTVYFTPVSSSFYICLQHIHNRVFAVVDASGGGEWFWKCECRILRARKDSWIAYYQYLMEQELMVSSDTWYENCTLTLQHTFTLLVRHIHLFSCIAFSINWVACMCVGKCAAAAYNTRFSILFSLPPPTCFFSPSIILTLGRLHTANVKKAFTVFRHVFCCNVRTGGVCEDQIRQKWRMRKGIARRQET